MVPEGTGADTPRHPDSRNEERRDGRRLDLRVLGYNFHLRYLGKESAIEPDGLSVVKGTLELLVLQTLESAGELHGFAMLEWIRRSTRDELVVEEGALYPALHRMEQRGWLTSSWGVSDTGRRAKFYRLTKPGSAALGEKRERWTRYVDAVARVATGPAS
jgi:transcriptional regulator